MSAAIWDWRRGRKLADVPLGRVASDLAEFAQDGRWPTCNVAYSPAGHYVALWGRNTGHDARVWDVHLETRSPEEIAKLADRTRWRIVDGHVVAREPVARSP